MIPVSVRGELPVTSQVAAWVNTKQERFHFDLSYPRHDLVLHVTDETYHGLFRVSDSRNVHVSNWQADGLQLYANLCAGELLGLSALLGLTQARALALNDFLRPEDFLHPSQPWCLFSTHPMKQDFAEVLDAPALCQGCVDFYRCIQLEPETETLQHVVCKLNRCRATRQGANGTK
ncbi:MAG: hypothetical protein HUU46_19670 [Candidatus Hydrogenedentes bacterium]|nr:hypothetical protein [Candidatus Hydrogenedentota bacterium]